MRFIIYHAHSGNDGIPSLAGLFLAKTGAPNIQIGNFNNAGSEHAGIEFVLTCQHLCRSVRPS